MSQSLMVLSYESIRKQNYPNIMQLIGFVFGILGGLILILPSEMEQLWKRLICKK